MGKLLTGLQSKPDANTQRADMWESDQQAISYVCEDGESV